MAAANGSLSRAEKAAAARARLAERQSVGAADENDRDIHVVVKGVTIGWLAQAFGINIRTIAQRLKDCPALKKKTGGAGVVYDLRTAAQYLVTPKFDVASYLQNAKIDELPAKFQTEFWSAALKRQQWETNAGKLWSTQEVSKRYSETFLMAANNMTMWVSNIESRVSMSEEIRLALEEEVRNLQAQISQHIKNMPRITPSQKATIKDDPLPAIEQDLPPIEDDDDDDFDITDVV
jgi:phage terminase Nu1 subunit (DNA packaging protein)